MTQWRTTAPARDPVTTHNRATGVIKHGDVAGDRPFGLTWNQMLEAGGVLVSKDISIELDVEGILETEVVVA